MTIHNLIAYYSACFKQDSSDFKLRNLNRLAKQDLLFIEGTDSVASGQLPRQALQPALAEPLAKRVEIYRRERVLLHGCFFVAATIDSNGETIKVFSPLVINEATIESDEYGFYFAMDPSAATANDDLLDLLFPERDSPFSLPIERAYKAIYWSQLLQQSPYKIEVLPALHFPELASEKALSRALRSPRAQLLSVSALAFVERSASSRGILYEHKQMQYDGVFSHALQYLLQAQNKATQPTAATQINDRLVPALLTQTQKKILHIAANYPLGSVSGPPGTGKSYTIAAVAAEHFTRNNSVLIVAHTETALEVIANKLKQDFGLANLAVRAGEKSFLREFKQYLEELLAGYHSAENLANLEGLQIELHATVKQIIALEADIAAQCANASKLGELAHQVNSKQANWWQRWVLYCNRRGIQRQDKLWQLQHQFNHLLAKKEALSKQYLTSKRIDVVDKLLSQNRNAVQALNRAVRARSSAKQAQYFQAIDFNTILQGFPVWLVSLNTLHKVLPLTKAMFNLVIIDEASQCNIASALPALYRAQRALVVGDQKQLRHQSFLSYAKQQQFAAEYQLGNNQRAVSYRDASIFDLAAESVDTQDQVAFLDEHFRSHSELIAFSNQHFYNQKLKIMRQRPCTNTGHLQVARVNGNRLSSGENREEAAAVIERIHSIIEHDTASGIATSIGVLSPFSKQVKYLAKLVEEKISLEHIEKHHLRVATPYGFQGEERDTMLISFCIDPQNLRAAAYLNRESVFNVALTRARNSQWLYLSIDDNHLPANNLLKQFLAHTKQFKLQHKHSSATDEFQQQLTTQLTAANIACWAAYPILGVEVDVLAKNKERYLAVDLIGYPGPWSKAFDLSSYKIIKRAGIEVLPISYALWLQDKERCLQAIFSALQHPEYARCSEPLHT
ncbi:MAG: AAA family ATPase [Cellvibrionaceae bacterium]|nr:AAA family ATPase [Cellvibrionaceae bacterium]